MYARLWGLLAADFTKGRTMKVALAFPGQGSQRIGMGFALAEAFPPAREVFEEVDDALDEHLSHTIFHGLAADLTETQNTQPALLAVSMAVLAVLRGEGGFCPAEDAAFVAGHSLGEYAALAAAGAITLADAARILRARGNAMRRATSGDAGAMSAVLGGNIAKIEGAAAAAAAETDGVCVIANDNAPGQVVLSGTTKAIERAEVLTKKSGAKRAVRLDVSAGFHSPLMAPAADEMAEILEDVAIVPPVPPVIANVTAAPVQDPDEIRDLLVRQVTGRVRWRESIAHLMAEGVATVVEIGAGKVLSGLVRRIEPELNAVSIETPGDVDAFLLSR